MDNSDKIKPLSEKIVTSLLKDETSIDLDTFNTLTEDDKKHILFSVTNKNKREERLQLKNKLNKQKAWKAIIGSEKQSNTKRKMIYWYSGIAASIILLLSITLLSNKNDELINTAIVAENNIVIGTDKAILTLEDGSEVRLEKGQIYQANNITSNGEEIIYLLARQADHTEARTKEIAYNTLTVPRGGQFQIKLSDGTKVWLNSESQLKYPVVFNGLETRKVELVYGEAYFDVSSSTLHNGTKFKVYNQSQEVEVLGTEFNIKAYKDEANIYTTLVEGKVVVNYQDKKQSLEPNQQLNLNIQNNNINITKIDNTYKEVSWKKGEFNFKNKTLKGIMKTLSRWYDMEVIFENKNAEDKIFTISFQKSFSIEEILSSIKYANSINDYNIKGKTLTIK
ncbi:FecR family protein [Flavivirga rizhaonensis]|uniref:FecR family protein n=1 Tax=Flavivirga rizhaonensis TaxID=2559571 RepID=A0A4S1E3N3_9FLAO|nr:FecR family protein [Flavivirga rizhaonensis]TGV04582.1 FecR family protein [Flavivirga rizhaonensis]